MAAEHGAVSIMALSPSGRTIENHHEFKWSGDVAHDMLLDDLDNDGAQDLVLGRISGKENVWVCYGNLWEHFAELESVGFVLGGESKQ